MAEEIQDEVPEPTNADLQRVGRLFFSIGGPSASWGAHQVLEVLLVEHRMRAERLASQHLTRATLVLVLATVALVLATVGLIFAALAVADDEGALSSAVLSRLHAPPLTRPAPLPG